MPLSSSGSSASDELGALELDEEKDEDGPEIEAWSNTTLPSGNTTMIRPSGVKVAPVTLIPSLNRPRSRPKSEESWSQPLRMRSSVTRDELELDDIDAGVAPSETCA